MVDNAKQLAKCHNRNKWQTKDKECKIIADSYKNLNRLAGVWKGGDKQVVPVGSLEQCAIKCAGTKGCQLYTYNPDGKQCALKSTHDASDHYLIPKSKDGKIYKLVGDSNREDAMLAAPPRTAELQDCVEQCNADPNCDYITHVPGRNGCYLKKGDYRSARSPVELKGWTSGFVPNPEVYEVESENADEDDD